VLLLLAWTPVSFPFPPLGVFLPPRREFLFQPPLSPNRGPLFHLFFFSRVPFAFPIFFCLPSFSSPLPFSGGHSATSNGLFRREQVSTHLVSLFLFFFSGLSCLPATWIPVWRLPLFLGERPGLFRRLTFVSAFSPPMSCGLPPPWLRDKSLPEGPPALCTGFAIGLACPLFCPPSPAVPPQHRSSREKTRQGPAFFSTPPSSSPLRCRPPPLLPPYTALYSIQFPATPATPLPVPFPSPSQSLLPSAGHASKQPRAPLAAIWRPLEDERLPFSLFQPIVPPFFPQHSVGM